MKRSYRKTPMPKCDFNKIAMQLYRNFTSARVLLEGCFCMFNICKVESLETCSIVELWQGLKYTFGNSATF